MHEGIVCHIVVAPFFSNTYYILGGIRRSVEFAIGKYRIAKCAEMSMESTLCQHSA